MNNSIVTKECKTFYARIYMAGDIAVATQRLREIAVDKGMCVNITSCNYVYTGGEESGFCVELINYPRFPKTPEDILSDADFLTRELMVACCQLSASLVTPDKTYWLTRRDEDVA